MNQASEAIEAELAKRYKLTMWTVLIQIVLAILLVFGAWFLSQITDNAITSQTTTGLWALFILITLIILVLRHFLFSWKYIKECNSQKGTKSVIEMLQTNTVLLGSLVEIIVIIGFIIATLNGDKIQMFRAGAIALVLFLVIYPRKQVWEKIIQTLDKNVV